LWIIGWLPALGLILVFGKTSSNALVSDPASTVYLPIIGNNIPLIGQVEIPWLPQNITVVNGLAYVSLCERDPDHPYDFTGGLQIIDISNPALPSKLGSYVGSLCIWDVAVDGRYAYAVGVSGNHVGGLLVLDISDPKSPFAVSAWSCWDGAGEVAGAEGYAYVGEGAVGAGLFVLDVSIPTAPTVVHQYPVHYFVNDILLRNNQIYLAATDGLRILDRATLTDIGYFPTAISLRNVVVQGKYAYLASDEGLHSVDISDLANPTEIGFLDITRDSSLVNIAVAGNYLYWPVGTNGVRILDISTPEAPIVVEVYSMPGEARSVAVDSNYAYVAHSKGVSIFTLYRSEN